MTVIAHVSDLHLLEGSVETRRGYSRWRLDFLTFGRPCSAERRRARALHILERARGLGAEHLVVTGDLTEEGHPSQFEVLASVLDESGWRPGAVTLVPGNHDAYGERGAWERALAGPLARHAPTSRCGAVVHLREVSVIAHSTMNEDQHFIRSGGCARPEAIERIEAAARWTRERQRLLVIAQHHPPFAHTLPVWSAIDGLRNAHGLLALLRRHEHAHVLHGHVHRELNRPVFEGAPPRSHSVEALAYGRAPLRLYGVRGSKLWVEERGLDAAHALLVPA